MNSYIIYLYISGANKTRVLYDYRYLVTLRNKIVHDHEFNKLPDRVHFAKSYDSVEKELKEKLKGSSASGCIIS